MNNIKTKRLTRLGILIIVLGILCLVGGFVLNNTDLFKKKNPDTPVKKNQKESEYSKKIGNLIFSVTNSNDTHCGYYKLFTNRKMTVNDLTNEEKAKMVSASLYLLNMKDNNSWEGTTYSKDEFEKAALELFGTGINHGTISGCPSLEYDSSKEEYKVVSNNCEKACEGATTMNRVISSTEKDGKLEFYVRIVFEKDGKYYSDYDRKKELSVETYEYGVIKNFDDLNKGSLYSVVFKVEDGNYTFDYVEPAE